MTITDLFIKGFANNNISIQKKDIQSIITSNSINLNIEKSFEALTEEDYYQIGLIINSLYLNKKYFLSEIIDLSYEHLNQINQSISLDQSIPNIESIEYFNIFNLDDEGCDITQRQVTEEILQNILDTFLINSKLKYNFKLKPRANQFDKQYIRSTENLIVLYTLKNNSDKIYYYFFNDKTDTHKLLQKLTQNKQH